MGALHRFRYPPLRELLPAYVLGGNLAGLTVIRSLGRAGIPVVAVVSSDKDRVHLSRYVSETIHLPDAAEEPEEYVDLLLAMAHKGSGVLIPTTDQSVGAVAAHRDQLVERFLVACPPYETASRFLDKKLTSDVAQRAGVHAPRTECPRNERELEKLAPHLAFPCLVKPRDSVRYTRAFGVKLHRLDGWMELAEVWRRAEALGIKTLIQELIPGPETGGVNYNVYMTDGEPRVEFTSRKVRLAPPHFGFPTAVVSDRVPEVVEPGRAIVHAMGIDGFANVEFKLDERDGGYKLMEVNGRPNLSGALAVRCGVDFPLLTYRHLVAGIPPSADIWRAGIYWIDEGADPGAAISRLRDDRHPLGELLRPYTSRHVFASMALDDPKLALSRAKTNLRRGLRRDSGRGVPGEPSRSAPS